MPQKTSTKRHVLVRLYHSIIKVPPALKADFSQKKLESNVTRIFVLALYIVCLQIALNVINIVKSSNPNPPDIQTQEISAISQEAPEPATELNIAPRCCFGKNRD